MEILDRLLTTNRLDTLQFLKFKADSTTPRSLLRKALEEGEISGTAEYPSDGLIQELDAEDLK